MKATYKIYFDDHQKETVQADMVTFNFPGFVIFADMPPDGAESQQPRLAGAYRTSNIIKVLRLGDNSGAAVH